MQKGTFVEKLYITFTIQQIKSNFNVKFMIQYNMKRKRTRKRK